MRRRSGLTGPESGQGTVEYILVLVVVIIIILSLLYQFNGSFRTYAMAFFDGYVACLLETGELPGTGSTCQAEFKAYDPTAGKGLLKDNLPDGKGGGGGGDSGKSQDGKDSKNAGRRGGGGEAVAGGNSGSARIGSLSDGGRRSQTDVGKLESDKPESLGADSLIGAANTTTVGRLGGNDRQQSVQMEYRFADSTDDKEEVKPSAAATKARVESGDSLRSSRGVERLSGDTRAPATEKDRSFSIGEFVRFMLILLIVVAMVIFFGGQLMQIARSRDKGGE